MPKPHPARDGAVLFDLDGTFADTAPDMVAALTKMLNARDRDGLPFEQVRPFCSYGARGILKVGFDLEPQDAAFEPLRTEYLAIYAAALVEQTVPFPGIPDLVDALEARGVPWGIVTNKATDLTLPLMEQIGFLDRAACIVCGDTAARPKPHPDPMFHACELIAVEPARCWYLGDAERDIRAGLAAGMGTLAALFGYLGPDDDASTWGAHGMVDHPLDVLSWLPESAD
ncbi:HAD family hydrolase [Thiocystis violacea]|uniref:HAD family hydrolase n=1 Tax=Thiocystis violacea TaxID=13725 RepID=UPI0019087281|nr:HAD-IA family hydrolase [Thiocystis violacea]MBK1722723.1 phosphoglycolate phosphatase [Thiocystis violacea]